MIDGRAERPDLNGVRSFVADLGVAGNAFSVQLPDMQLFYILATYFRSLGLWIAYRPAAF